MAPSNFAIALLILAAASIQGSSFDVQRHDGHRLRIRLNEDEALILPRKYALLRPPPTKGPHPPQLPPSGEKFRPDPRFKKPVKYFIKPNSFVKVKSLPAGLLLDQQRPHYDSGAAGWLLPPAKEVAAEGGQDKELGFDELFQPVGLGLRPRPGLETGDGLHYADDDIGVADEGRHHHHHFDDLKPVSENVDDDLKYDFRTKSHSI